MNTLIWIITRFKNTENKIKNEEHDFSFSNIKKINNIINNQKIQNLLIYENDKDNKNDNNNKFIIVKSLEESVYII